MGLANQSVTPGRTSLLEAVNVCLAVIGEAPINTLETQQVGEAAQAERTLLEYHKEGQTRGWSWNREQLVPFYRDASGEVLIPASVVKWAPSRLEWNNRFQARGSRVYDAYERTYSISADIAAIEADIVSLLPWDDCPEVFNRWATVRAARVFSNRAVGNTTTYQLTQSDEDQAWADLLRVDTEQSQANAITGDQAWATFVPAMGLGRRTGAGLYGYGTQFTRGSQAMSTSNGSVTSVGLSAPVGFAVTGSPVTSAGTLALGFADGYSLPTTAQQSVWDSASGRLDAFRDANRVYVSPTTGSDTNNGTSLGEPLRTLAAAAAAAQPGDLVVIGPGVYIEAALPIRWRRNVGLFASGLRNTSIRPAIGQEMNGFFRVDSGFWCWGLEFAGHQANSATGEQAWAISFNELADNRDIGAVGLGAFILKSPYIQNCSSITAEDDSGTAGSVSTGDTGGGILVDGSRCAANSPIRSMVVDSYTQVNLGGPGCLVQNDGYAQLVSFFGTFCEYHVKTLAGGQVNLSGGGTSDFGIYGLVASGYSPKAVFTGASRIAKYGAARIDKAVTISDTTDTFTCVSHGLSANDQITFSASQGTLPTPLVTGTTYYVRSSGLTTNAFTVSATSGGALLDITQAATGTYTVVRQGVTEVDVIGFSANRLGRQVKYPTAGSLGAIGSPVTISAVSGSTLTVTLGTSTIAHEYVGGGTITVAGTSYDVTAATYNGATGVTTIAASGYTPVVGASVTLAGLSFICNSTSRPSAGQLMFPQLVFPRNASTGVAEAKTFTYTKTGTNTLTYAEAASASGPDHEYVKGGTVVIGGTNYGVTAAAYDKTSGLVTITTVTPLPGSTGSTGSAIVNGLVYICPASAYVVTSSVPIDASGNAVANDSASRAGYRVLFYSGTNGGLRNALAAGQILDFRQRSQISAPGHTFEYVGAGTNYNALPWNGGVPIPANKIVESNNGRIYSSNTDELGNFAVGTQFSVDGTTGRVTINTDQFNLSGLNFIGPFSRNGGISTVGEQLREISNNTSLLASTGAPDGNTVPSQFAVKTYADNKFLQGLTATLGQPISISDTSTVDSQGFQTRIRNISLSVGTTAGTVAAGDDSRLAGALSAATAATTYQPLDSDLTAIAALATASAGRSLLTLASVPSGALVGTSDTQTLSAKTLGNLKETVYTITDGAAFEIDPANGPIQTITLGANRSPAATNFASGQSVKLKIDDGTAYAITWTTVGVVWIGQTAGSSGTAPTLGTTGWTHIELWKEGSIIYGALIGYSAT